MAIYDTHPETKRNHPHPDERHQDEAATQSKKSGFVFDYAAARKM
jgi:hypothetical protein